MCRYCNGAARCCAEPVFTPGICGRGDRAAALLLRPREGVSNRRVGWGGSAALIQPAPPTLPGCAAHYHGHLALASAGAVHSPSMTMQVTAWKPWGGCAGQEWCWMPAAPACCSHLHGRAESGRELRRARAQAETKSQVQGHQAELSGAAKPFPYGPAIFCVKGDSV